MNEATPLRKPLYPVDTTHPQESLYRVDTTHLQESLPAENESARGEVCNSIPPLAFCQNCGHTKEAHDVFQALKNTKRAITRAKLLLAGSIAGVSVICAAACAIAGPFLPPAAAIVFGVVLAAIGATVIYKMCHSTWSDIAELEKKSPFPDGTLPPYISTTAQGDSFKQAEGTDCSHPVEDTN